MKKTTNKEIVSKINAARSTRLMREKEVNKIKSRLNYLARTGNYKFEKEDAYLRNELIYAIDDFYANEKKLIRLYKQYFESNELE